MGYDTYRSAPADRRWLKRVRVLCTALIVLGVAGAIGMFLWLPAPHGHGDKPFPAWTYDAGHVILACLALGLVLAVGSLVIGGRRPRA